MNNWAMVRNQLSMDEKIQVRIEKYENGGILMEELHKKWEKIHHCLQALEAADQEQEAEILKKAYECLLCAYQESRALNDEMEMLVKDTLTS